jgi:hypothetical protein
MKSSNTKVKQQLYKPTKEVIKIVPKIKKQDITFDQVVEYFVNLAWLHRGFLLITALIVSWTLFLVLG